MLNYIWGGLIFVSFLSAIATGRMEEVSKAVLEGAQDAVKLSFSMLGLMGFWMGVMKVAQEVKITKFFSKLLYPLLHLLFPRYQKESKIMQTISMNVTANLLGLGNAATPLGLAAMQAMNEEKREMPSKEMCLFVLMNTASIQLIPTTLLAMRSEYGSVDPFEIVPAVWITSAVVFMAVILVGKFCEKLKGRGNR